MHTGAHSWAEVRIPREQFRGTTVLAAPPEWCLPFAPMRPSTYRGPTRIWAPNGDGDTDCQYELAPVLICDAWGRPPAVTGCDRLGQAMPPHSRGELSADFLGRP